MWRKLDCEMNANYPQLRHLEIVTIWRRFLIEWNTMETENCATTEWNTIPNVFCDSQKFTARRPARLTRIFSAFSRIIMLEHFDDRKAKKRHLTQKHLFQSIPIYGYELQYSIFVVSKKYCIKLQYVVNVVSKIRIAWLYCKRFEIWKLSSVAQYPKITETRNTVYLYRKPKNVIFFVIELFFVKNFSGKSHMAE